VTWRSQSANAKVDSAPRQSRQPLTGVSAVPFSRGSRMHSAPFGFGRRRETPNRWPAPFSAFSWHKRLTLVRGWRQPGRAVLQLQRTCSALNLWLLTRRSGRAVAFCQCPLLDDLGRQGVADGGLTAQRLGSIRARRAYCAPELAGCRRDGVFVGPAMCRGPHPTNGRPPGLAGARQLDAQR